jgi:serine/threonine protein kinase
MARMSQLLDEALALDEVGRRAWLEIATQAHTDLAAALREALLPEATRAADLEALMTLPKLGSDGARAPPASGLQSGARVGPYELIRLLGGGGMAEVWLARRADGALKREIALKLPMLAHAQAGLTARFARERDILASLEHPHIARLYDAGADSEGLPYLAMEYVQGAPLTDWCDAHMLDLRQRLALFLQVLEAVQFAHERQVIHRDLKPSNILVTESGQVRLLDFGIASLLEAQKTDGWALTSLYGRALTPDYASPELLRGDPIDARSDIYSLGILLYELLTGTQPYRLKMAASIGALDQAIATLEVKRPSVQLEQAVGPERASTKLRSPRQLRGDLDAIVLNALAKRPEDRYGSVSALAHDLQRYLSGTPVNARPAYLSYRFTKFVLRHPVAVPAGATAILLFVAMGWGLMRREVSVGPPAPSASSIPPQAIATQQPTPTVAAKDKAIAVLPFVDMSEKHDQEYFSDGLSEELIDRLSHSQNLKVISRTSSFYFKGKQATIGEIADTLHVSHILEGSVRRSGQTLRITAQLIRAEDGIHLWSQSYDRKASDIFKIQDDIARTVARSLKTVLGEAGTTAGETEPNIEAYNLLLQGNFFRDRNTKADSFRAAYFYEGAVKLDPNYALAWAKLSFLYQIQAGNAWIPIAVGNAKARDAVDRALRINPNLAYAHTALGGLYLGVDWNWAAAEAEYERAHELDPQDLNSATDLAYVRGCLFGRFDEYVALQNQLLLRDPLDVVALSHLGQAQFLAGRLEQSAATFSRLLAMNPSSASAGAFLALDLSYLGRNAEALLALQKETDEAWRLSASPVVYWALGRRAESDTDLAELERRFALGFAYNIAEMHAYRGEIDAAFTWLDRAYRQRDAAMMWLRIDPTLRNLRMDPRYRALLNKMKLDGEGPRTSN